MVVDTPSSPKLIEPSSIEKKVEQKEEEVEPKEEELMVPNKEDDHVPQEPLEVRRGARESGGDPGNENLEMAGASSDSSQKDDDSSDPDYDPSKDRQG